MRKTCRLFNLFLELFSITLIGLLYSIKGVNSSVEVPNLMSVPHDFIVKFPDTRIHIPILSMYSQNTVQESTFVLEEYNGGCSEVYLGLL